MPKWFRPGVWYASGLALVMWAVALPRDRSFDHFGGLTSGAAILLTVGLLFFFLGFSMAKLERSVHRD